MLSKYLKNKMKFGSKKERSSKEKNISTVKAKRLLRLQGWRVVFQGQKIMKSFGPIW